MVGEESAFSFLMGSTRANADGNVKGSRGTVHAIAKATIRPASEIGYSATTRTNRRPSIFAGPTQDRSLCQEVSAEQFALLSWATSR
jgi:hypothetical protein